MITSILGRKITITWKDNESRQVCTVKAFDVLNGWLCLENEDDQQSVWWVRLDDIDNLVVSSEEYDPTSAGNIPSGMMKAMFGASDEEEGEPSPVKVSGSPMRITMEFNMPDAASDFYMASNAENAFSVLSKTMDMLEEESRKSPGAETRRSMKKALKRIAEWMIDYGIAFGDDDEEDGGQPKPKPSAPSVAPAAAAASEV